jgi:hypothetical protein
LPFFQFLPLAIQLEYNRLLGTHISKGQVQELALLSARGLRRVSPTGRMVKMRITIWSETLVAYRLDLEGTPDAKL